ncbi:hypothetical protein NC652_033291 [Populus alba x Populus x berolinensis]|nr:hypothetical protein NC652_033291 [Populus alba x Populus x berolinensis]
MLCFHTFISFRKIPLQLSLNMDRHQRITIMYKILP